jgi:CO/xanthine dehydrogenase FAD-binding subunit
MSSYTKAATLDAALAALGVAARPVVLAGGTDVYPVMTTQAAWFRNEAASILDIGGLAELRGVGTSGGEVRLGALATWSDIAAADLSPAFDALKAAARQVGGVQIQNRGTLGGNLCNASPAADGVPPLLALDAEVELQSIAGIRRLPLGAFVLGNRRTALRPDELLTAVIVPRPAADERSTFVKLGARAYLVISIASVAANVRLDGAGRIAAARIAVGACSAAPLRLPRVEREVVGLAPDAVSVALAAEDGLSPIDDVRASAAYRMAAAATALSRALATCAPSGARAA